VASIRSLDFCLLMWPMKTRIISGTVEWRSNVIACNGITHLHIKLDPWKTAWNKMKGKWKITFYLSANQMINGDSKRLPLKFAVSGEIYLAIQLYYQYSVDCLNRMFCLRGKLYRPWMVFLVVCIIVWMNWAESSKTVNNSWIQMHMSSKFSLFTAFLDLMFF